MTVPTVSVCTFSDATQIGETPFLFCALTSAPAFASATHQHTEPKVSQETDEYTNCFRVSKL